MELISRIFDICRNEIECVWRRVLRTSQIHTTTTKKCRGLRDFEPHLWGFLSTKLRSKLEISSCFFFPQFKIFHSLKIIKVDINLREKLDSFDTNTFFFVGSQRFLSIVFTIIINKRMWVFWKSWKDWESWNLQLEQ